MLLLLLAEHTCTDTELFLCKIQGQVDLGASRDDYFLAAVEQIKGSSGNCQLGAPFCRTPACSGLGLIYTFLLPRCCYHAAFTTLCYHAFGPFSCKGGLIYLAEKVHPAIHAHANVQQLGIELSPRQKLRGARANACVDFW